jgi:transposase
LPGVTENVLSVVTPKGEMNYSVTEESVNSERYIKFLDGLIHVRERPLILIVDQASFHGSKKFRKWVRAHRGRLRIFFLTKHSPELNPDEQVWNEIKNNTLGKQPIKNKRDLKQRLYSALRSLQRQSERIRSFFQLPDTLYASMNVR